MIVSQKYCLNEYGWNPQDICLYQQEMDLPCSLHRLENAIHHSISFLMYSGHTFINILLRILSAGMKDIQMMFLTVACVMRRVHTQLVN